MRGMRQGALIAALMVVATAAAAETVPLPVPAPFPKTGIMPPPSSLGRNHTAQNSGPSWLPQIFGGKPDTQTTGLEPAQRTLVEKVNAYLTRVQVMSGNFVQIGPDGKQTKGQFYVQKPGRVRFDYDPPARIEIVADGSSVVVHDRKMSTNDVYPLSQTPLRFLLSDRIDLLRDTNVTGVYADDTYVTVAVEERSLVVGTSKLMMMFGAKDYALKQWVVTDPQGFDTTIVVSNIDTTSKLDPGLFYIDHGQFRN